MFVLAVLTASGLAVGAEPWDRFQNGGRVTVSAEAPLRWSETEGIAWQTELAGYGQSSPIVHGETIYVTSISGDQKEQLHVEALDLATGKPKWHFTASNSSPAENNGYISKAAPTPAADANGVIALFEGGNVFALTPEGKVRWQRDLVADFGPITSRHGLASSVEQDDERVYLWIERQENPYVVCLAKESGDVIWKTEGLGATSWSSPRLVAVDEGHHLVCSAGGRIVGLNPADGSKLWELTDVQNNTACTPMPLGGGRFLIGASDGRGEESGARGASSNGMIQIRRQGDGRYMAEFAWRAAKASSTFGSPIAAGGKVYLVNRAGVLFQLDEQTGTEHSATRMGAGGIWATPLVIGDYLYLFGYQGTTSVVSLQDGQEISQNRLWAEQAAPAGSAREPQGAPASGVLYAAVPAPPYLLLRRGDVLYAVASESSAR